MDLPDTGAYEGLQLTDNPVARRLDRWCEHLEWFCATRLVPILFAVAALRILWQTYAPIVSP